MLKVAKHYLSAAKVAKRWQKIPKCRLKVNKQLKASQK